MCNSIFVFENSKDVVVFNWLEWRKSQNSVELCWGAKIARLLQKISRPSSFEYAAINHNGYKQSILPHIHVKYVQ